MTYIEFFDETASENVCACLTYAPDRVVYIGEDAELMEKHIENYKKVFSARGSYIEFMYRTIPNDCLDSAVRLLTELAEAYDDCVFDVTGGGEIYVLALGIVCANHPHKNIQIHRFNLDNNVICDCDKDGTTIYRDAPSLTARENIRIYGGDVVYGNVDEAKTYKWKLSPDFEADIDKMWKCCKGSGRSWNIVTGILGVVEKVGNKAVGALHTTVAKRWAVEKYLTSHKAKYIIYEDVMNYLRDNRLITFFDDSDGKTITVSYKNEQVKRCLTKAGQALEMRVFVSAKYAVDDKGNTAYNDALNGVLIDWDGKLHDEAVEDEYDTENEIDILLMHGVVPVFISCKNGLVTADELYKLNTVAERFGGQYAKKVLISTAISNMGEKGEYLRQRAEDMDIRILDDLQDAEDDEIPAKLANLWKTDKSIIKKI